jgi:hypothetical protein
MKALGKSSMPARLRRPVRLRMDARERAAAFHHRRSSIRPPVMNAEQTEIKGTQVIHQVGQLDPTHAVEVDGWFYAVTNVGWNKVDDNTGQLKPGEKFTPPVLLRFSEHAPWHAKN